jgi:pantothenate kinase type III
MRLEIDLGNSYLKWRYMTPLRVSGGRLLLAELDAWLAEQSGAITEIWISSVASDSVNH